MRNRIFYLLIFTVLLILSLGLMAFQNGDMWVIFDDFETVSGYFLQPFDTSEYGSARIVNGKLESSIWAAEEFNYFPLAVDAPESVWLDVDVNLVGDELAVGAGVACNFDVMTYEGVFFEIIFDQDIDIFATHNGDYYFLKDFGTDHAYWVDDFEEVGFYHSDAIDSYGTNTIHMICDRGSYSVGVNGQMLGSFPAPPFELKGNGLSLYSYTYFDEGGIVQFDNFSAEGQADQTKSTSTKPTTQTTTQTNSSKWSHFENFDDGVSDFFVSSSNTEGILVNHINGGLEVHNPATVEKRLLTNTIRGYAENVLIEFDATLVNGNPSNGVRLVCHANDNGDGIFFEVDFDQEYKMFAYYNDEHYQFTDFGSTNQTWTRTEDTIDFLYSSAISTSYNYITVECNNGTFKFSVNGQLLQQGSYPFDFDGKDIDLISVNHMDDDYTVRFDNFYAEEIGYESAPVNAPTPSSSPLNNNNETGVIYSEFAYNDGIFNEFDYEHFSTYYRPNGYEIQFNISNYTVWNTLNVPTPKNGSISVDVEMVDGPTISGAGVSCDAYFQSNDSYEYGTQFYIMYNGYYGIFRTHPGSSYALKNNQWQVFAIDSDKENFVETDLIIPNQINTIRMDCDHDRRAFYINGTLVAEYIDHEPTYETSHIILAKNYDKPNTIIRFKKLLITEIQ